MVGNLWRELEYVSWYVVEVVLALCGVLEESKSGQNAKRVCFRF